MEWPYSKQNFSVNFEGRKMRGLSLYIAHFSRNKLMQIWGWTSLNGLLIKWKL